MSNELRKNAEGYADPTAAATLSRKESGDIWTYKGGECLIIKGHPGFATILRLHDSDKYGDRVKVADRDDGPRYVDPAFIISGRYSEMGQYVETLDVNTFTLVIEAVEDAIGLSLLGHYIPAQDLDAQEVQELREQLAEAQATIEELREEAAQLKEDLEAMRNMAKLYQRRADESREEEIKARLRLGLLREMYDDLLAKVVKEG